MWHKHDCTSAAGESETQQISTVHTFINSGSHTEAPRHWERINQLTQRAEENRFYQSAHPLCCYWVSVMLNMTHQTKSGVTAGQRSQSFYTLVPFKQEALTRKRHESRAHLSLWSSALRQRTPPPNGSHLVETCVDIRWNRWRKGRNVVDLLRV